MVNPWCSFAEHILISTAGNWTILGATCGLSAYIFSLTVDGIRLLRMSFRDQGAIVHINQMNILSARLSKDMKTRPLIYLLLTIVIVEAEAQRTNSSTPIRNYYYDYKLANPAFTGTTAQHAVTTAYSGHESDLAGAPRSAYLSYEVNLKSIQSGLGIISSVEELGILRWTSYGLLYSRNFLLGEKRGVLLGGQFVYQRKRADYTKLQFADPFDPSFRQVEKTSSANVSLGLAYYSPMVTVGAGFKNVVKEEAETREYNVVVARDFKIGKALEVTPSLFFITDTEYNSVRLNSTFKFFRWGLLGAGYTFPRSGRDNIDFNIGINILDRVQIINHVYASEYATARGNNGTATWLETMLRVRIGELNDSPANL